MQRNKLEELANSPQKLLSAIPGVFSLFRAQDYHLFECLCSPKLDRAHPETDVRQMIDTDFANHLQQHADPNSAVHILDVGSGLLFSSAVRAAKLAFRKFKDIHLYLTDPLYDDALQKREIPSNPKRLQMADAAKTAFPEFARLMHDCGIDVVMGKEQGNTSAIANEFKLDDSKSDKSKPRVHIHIFGHIDQVPIEVIQQINAALIIDVFPPIPLRQLLGKNKKYFSNDMMVFICKEKFLPKSQMLTMFNTETISHYVPNCDRATLQRIKETGDNIIKRFYPDDANGNFDAFFAEVFNEKLPKEIIQFFIAIFKSVSDEALEVRKVKGSELHSLDWDDAVDSRGQEHCNLLQTTNQPLPIYRTNPFPLWNNPADAKFTADLPISATAKNKL